jgi:hypothetical protein
VQRLTCWNHFPQGCTAQPHIDQTTFGAMTIAGQVGISAQAAYFQRKQCQVELRPTSEAIRVWNAAEGAVIGLFHLTC